jgi:hypothetical protein
VPKVYVGLKEQQEHKGHKAKKEMLELVSF